MGQTCQGGLNSVRTKIYAEILILGTCECDLIWNRVFADVIR